MVGDAERGGRVANSTGSTVRLLGPTAREAHAAKGQPTGADAGSQADAVQWLSSHCGFRREAVSKDKQQTGKRNERSNWCIGSRFGWTEEPRM